MSRDLSVWRVARVPSLAWFLLCSMAVGLAAWSVRYEYIDCGTQACLVANRWTGRIAYHLTTHGESVAKQKLGAGGVEQINTLLNREPR